MNFRTLLLASLWTLFFQADATAQDWIYKTRTGDTLWDICLQYTNKSGCWTELEHYNQIAQVKKIPVGSEIRIPQAWLIVLPVVGHVAGMDGDALYLSRVGENLVPLVAGQPLVLGSTIITREGSVRISLGGASNILLRENSELLLNSLSTTGETGQSSELDLKRGQIEIEVKAEQRRATRFEIKTPSAIAAVRGTRYRLAVLEGQEQSTRAEVTSGVVVVKGTGEATVNEGYGILARKDTPLKEPSALLRPPVFERDEVESPMPVSIAWHDNPDAVAWRIDLMGGANNDIPVARYRSSEPEVTLSDVAPGCYQLVVAGVDAQGFTGLDQQLRVCLEEPLPAPVEVVEASENYWVHAVMTALFLIVVLL